MMKYLYFLKTLFIGFGVSVVVNAQQTPQTCGTDPIMEDLFNQQPALRELYNRQVQEVQRKIQLNGRNTVVPTVIEIPVVVHVLEDGNSAYYKTDQEIQNWLNRANSIFDGTANDIIREENGGAKIPVRLVLAKRNPQNQATTGILRHNLSNNPTYVSFGVKRNTTQGLDYKEFTLDKQWDSDSYYNVYIVNKFDGVDGYRGGILGFAYYPGYSQDYSYMVTAVVKNTDTTFAHEMMHAFGIKHVFTTDWGADDGNGSKCGGEFNDHIDDTQRTRSGLYFGLPFNTFNQYVTYPITGQTINDCTNTPFDGVQHNIMNYGSILDRFTLGQSNFAYQTIESYRSSIKTSLGATPIDGSNLRPVVSCSITGDNQNLYFRFNNVSFGTINNRNSVALDYVDYTLKNYINSIYTTDLFVGETLNLTVGSSLNSSNKRKFSAYIDYNNNGAFEESEKIVNEQVFSEGEITKTFPITLPTTAVKNVPLRIRLVGGISDDYIDPENLIDASDVKYGACDTRKMGQVVDYTVIIKEVEGCSGISENITANLIDNSNGNIILRASGILPSTETIIQWEKSSDNLSWSNIINANSVNYSQAVFGNAGDITYYRLKVTCNGVNYYSSVTSHRVDYCQAKASYTDYERISNVTFGDINNNSTSILGYEDFTDIKTIVYKGQTLNFSASYADESFSSNEVIVWIDYNQDEMFDSSEKVLITEKSLSPWIGAISIPSSALSGETRMRVRLHDTSNGPNYDACGNSSYGQVEDYTVNILSDTTTWNGSSWSNGEPNGSKKVIVNGALELNTDIISKELTVNEGGSVIVKAGKTLNVTEKITNNSTADKFIVESEGHVIQMANVINEGQFTVHRNSDLMVRNDMTFWSSPVSGQNVRSFSPETLENRFWTYREDTDLFSQLFTTEGENKPSSSYNFEPGKGVSIRSRNTLPTGQSEAFAGTFVGTLNNGDIFLPVLKMLNGYNLVGNPYPSSISSTQFMNLNPNVSALYFWSHKYPVGHANYNLNYDSYTIAGPSSGDLSKIATGQGFIIKSDFNGMVHFSNILRNNSPAEFNRSTEIERNRIWLGLNKNEEPQNQILVAYMTNATNEFDHQIDGKRMQGGGTQLYTLLNNEAYAIQGRQLPFSTEDVVKLGLEVAEAGTLSISLNAVDGLFEEGQEVYILDKLTNSVHNLSASAYQFNAEAGTFNERFEVLYTNRNLSTTDLKSDDIKVYKNGETFVVESSKSKIISVELVDVQGRKLFSESKLNTNRFEGYTAAKGVLIIKVATEDGQIKTQKLIK